MRMISQKVKTKPPPLHLHYNEEETVETQISEEMSREIKKLDEMEEMHGQAEFYKQFESVLIDLLQEDELLPFNLHVAASLGIITSVRNLVERYFL